MIESSMTTRSGCNWRGNQTKLKRLKTNLGKKKLMKFETEADEIESMLKDDMVHHIPTQSVSQKWDQCGLKDSNSPYQLSETKQDTANNKYKDNIDENLAHMQQIEKMSTEELAGCVFECIKLCTENKINIKNAFSLHLVDWLLHLLKHKNNFINSFSILACTLDASTKIYSHRVDIIHKEVLRFRNWIMFTVKNKKGIFQNDEEGGVRVKTINPINRLKKKKTVLMNPMSLQRMHVGKNPLNKFVKLRDQPGELMEAMLKTGKTFSSEAPFRPNCKNLYVQGKLVPLRIRCQYHCVSSDQQFCSLSRICDHLLGRSTKKEDKVSAIESNKCEEDFDTDTAHEARDQFFDTVLAEFDESTASTKREDIVDVMAQKVKESMLVNQPKPFDNLSRMEKLSLFLLPNSNTLVNPDLEDLLYGPLHAKCVWKNPVRVVRRKKPMNTKRTKSVVFLNFEADLDCKLVASNQPMKLNGKNVNPRMKRKTLMPKTVNNWNEVKVMGPEEIIINTDFLHVLKIKEDIPIRDNNDDFMEDCSDFELFDINMKTCSSLFYDDIEEEDPSVWVNQVDCPKDTKVVEKQIVTGKEDKPSLMEGEAKQDAVDVSNHIEEPVIPKFQNLNCLAVNRHVNMKRLKDTIKNVMGVAYNASDCTESKSELREQESGNEFQPVAFSDLYSQVLSRLNDCSPNSLTPQMAFVGLLHVMSENELLQINDDNNATDPLIIKKVKNSDCIPKETGALSQTTSGT